MPEHPFKYPPFQMRLKKHASNTLVFDSIRKKWLILTPEELVRQHVVNYLVHVIRISPSFISIEKELLLNDIKKRYDIVVFGLNLKPKLIVECKAPYISLTPDVVAQAQRYNLTVQADLLMITNGVVDFVFNKDNQVTELTSELLLVPDKP